MRFLLEQFHQEEVDQAAAKDHCPETSSESAWCP
jgi:hypothetical protein